MSSNDEIREVEVTITYRYPLNRNNGESYRIDTTSSDWAEQMFKIDHDGFKIDSYSAIELIELYGETLTVDARILDNEL